MENKEIVYADTEPDEETIRQIVGGYFTTISLKNHKLMYVNEEGELQKLHLNKSATSMVGYNIYGNVLILSPAYIIQHIPLNL